MEDSPLFKAISALLAAVSLLILLFGAQAVFAQNVHVCRKDGRQVMTDRPCADLGAETRAIRTPESFTPLSGGGGLTDGERRMAAEYRQRDAAADRQRQQVAARQQMQQSMEEVHNHARCQELDREKMRIVALLRQNSTQWANDRHREINDEMYLRRCTTL